MLRNIAARILGSSSDSQSTDTEEPPPAAFSHDPATGTPVVAHSHPNAENINNNDNHPEQPPPESADSAPSKRRRKSHGKKDKAANVRPLTSELGDDDATDVGQNSSAIGLLAEAESPGPATRKKKKDRQRQTSQEEESAQALLALNKGLAHSGLPDSLVPVAEDNASGKVPEQQPEAPKKRKSRKKPKKTKRTTRQSDEGFQFIQQNVEPVETTDGKCGAMQDISQGAELQDSQHIISQHLAAHMSKNPPLPSAMPIQEDTPLELNSGLYFPPVPPPSYPEGSTAENLVPYDSHRKRLGEDESNHLVDPALMELDAATAAAAGMPRANSDGDALVAEPSKGKRKRKSSSQDISEEVLEQNQQAAAPARRIRAPRKVKPHANGNGANGPFSLEERHAIDKQLNEYAIMNNLTQAELCNRVWCNERKKDNFWENVCEVLPQRSRASIYKHVRRSYHVFKVRAKWTEDEDIELERLVKEKGSQWNQIGEALERMGEDCRDRWRNYVKCGKNRGTDRWDPDEEANLKRVVAEMLEKHRAQPRELNVDEMQVDEDGEDERGINWTVVSDLMENRRSRIQCRYKWNKMKQRQGDAVANPTPRPSHTTRKKKGKYDTSSMLVGDNIWLLRQMRDSGITVENQIPWDAIAESDELGIWTGKDLHNAYKTLRSDAPHKRRPLVEIVRLLLSELEDLPAHTHSQRFIPLQVSPGSAHSPIAAPVSPMDNNGHHVDAQEYQYMAHENPHDLDQNMAPVASMGGPVFHDSVDVDMVDPELIGQGLHQDLEKTAGAAIAFAAAANRDTIDEDEDEQEKELRRRLGVIV